MTFSLTKKDILIKKHSPFYRMMVKYNTDLPVFLLTQSEPMRLEILEIRGKMLEFVKELDIILHNEHVMEALKCYE